MTGKRNLISDLYDKLYSELKKKGDLKDDSVLYSLIHMRSKKRLEYLKNFSVSATESNLEMIKNLKERNKLRMIDKLDSYCLTAHSIWEEDKRHGRTINDLIESIDHKFFSVEMKELSEKEKVVLLSFIALRSFYKDFSVDVKEKYVRDRLKELMEESINLLQKIGVVKGTYSEEKFYGKRGNESPVSNVIRHAADSLAKKTFGTMKVKDRDQKYYLDIYDGEKIDSVKLKTLIGQIFSSRDVIKHRNELLDFLKRIPKDYGLYIFGNSEFFLSDPKVDYLIQKVIEDYVLD